MLVDPRRYRLDAQSTMYGSLWINEDTSKDAGN
jgi:hypothetical protein